MLNEISFEYLTFMTSCSRLAAGAMVQPEAFCSNGLEQRVSALAHPSLLSSGYESLLRTLIYVSQHHTFTTSPKTKIGHYICLDHYFVGFPSSLHFSRISEVKLLQTLSHFPFELNQQKSYLPSAFHPEADSASCKVNATKMLFRSTEF